MVVEDFVIIGCGVVGYIAVKEKMRKILEYLSIISTKLHLLKPAKNLLKTSQTKE